MTTQIPTPLKSLIFLYINSETLERVAVRGMSRSLSLTLMLTYLSEKVRKFQGFLFSLINLVQILKMSNFSFSDWSQFLDQWGASSSSSSSNANRMPEKITPTATSVEKLIKDIENPLTREHALFLLSRVYEKTIFHFCNLFGW